MPAHLRRMPSKHRRLLAVGALILLGAVPASATTIFKFRIVQFFVAGGRIAFVANGLTILDTATGRPVLREPEVRYAQIEERPGGLIVATPTWSHASRVRLFSTRADPAWDVRCDLWHPAERYLICVTAWSWLHATIEARSLDDGQVRWRYDTHGAGGEAMDAKNRLMIANESYVTETEVGPNYSSTYPAAHAKSLTVLDIDTGRVLATTALPDLNVAVHGFDGDRVVLDVRPKSGCTGYDVHTFTVDAAAGAFASTVSACEKVTQQQPAPSAAPAWTEVERQLAPASYPFEDGAIVTFRVGYTTVLERRSVATTWQATQRTWLDNDRRLDVQGVFARGDTVYVQYSDWTVGILDALDAATGRARWRYVFPTRAQFGSIGVFGRPDPPSPGALADGWHAVIANPPPPLVPAASTRSLDEILSASNTANDGRDQEAARSNAVFDPAADGAFAALSRRLAVRWTAIALGGLFVIVPLAGRLAPRTSMRRVLLALARYAYLAALLLVVGVPSLVAGLLVRVLLLAAFVQAGAATVRVQTARAWLVRCVLVLVLLPLGALTLVLFA
jgi:hypothetical protein